eukprot:TRINITY_DN8774_c0_g1_i4.p1 TRINITY_DN8774_c0_g1~~TRINITY_DN8774_c0_g1_i4.p1  ORF type:complete len:774 (+),score=229.29 TRINITY_DN8774_c0_g1_i4:196-2322(+)
MAVQTNLDALSDELEAVSETADAATTSIGTLRNTKADKTEAINANSVRTIVAAMLAGEPANNALQTALARKLDTSDKYDDTDVENVVTTIVTASGNSNALRAKLDGLTSQVNEVIANQDYDCGNTCAAGEYVSASCVPGTNQRTCSSCPANTYSLGGLIAQCVACATTCPAEHHKVADCTSTRDIQCSKCSQCVAGVAYETAPCTTSADRACTACKVCADDEYMVSPCNATANTVCAKCTACDASDVEFRSRCTSTMDAVCMPKSFGAAVKMGSTQSQSAVNSWRTITSWNQAASNAYPSHFIRGPVLGQRDAFRAPQEGVYFLSANIRLDGFSSGKALIRLDRGATPGDQDGAFVIHDDSSFLYRTLSTAIIGKLAKDDLVRVRTRSSTDTSWAVSSNSMLSVFSIHPTEGLLAELTGTVAVKAKGWFYPTNWRTSGFSSAWADAPGGFTDGKYTVDQDGVFIVTYTQRIDRATADGSRMRLAIALNGTPLEDGGIHAFDDSPGNSHSMSVTGAIYAKKGDTIRPAVWSRTDDDYTLGTNAGFSLARVETKVAFNADLNGSVAVTRKSRQVLRGDWRTSGANTLFNIGQGFDEELGVFTAPLAGYYFVAINIRLDTNDARYYRIFVKSSSDSGFHETAASSIRGASYVGARVTQKPFQSVTPTGVMKLNKGDQLSVWVEIPNESSAKTPYTVQDESGFSAVLLKEIV